MSCMCSDLGFFFNLPWTEDKSILSKRRRRRSLLFYLTKMMTVGVGYACISWSGEREEFNEIVAAELCVNSKVGPNYPLASAVRYSAVLTSCKDEYLLLSR